MEIILTRNQLMSNLKNHHINNIEIYAFTGKYFKLFNECYKISFRDDDGSIKILKDRNGK
jgi:hypothetical protein